MRPGALRYRTGAYAAWAVHVGVLLGDAESPALVDALLAPLAPDVFAHQRERGLSVEEITDGLETLARRVMAA